ncbi:MAG: ABC transporter substrate-binding protein [Bacillota bacterium]
MKRYRTADLAKKRLAEGAYKTKGTHSHKQKQKALIFLILFGCLIFIMSNMYQVLKAQEDFPITETTLLQSGESTLAKKTSQESTFTMVVEHLDRTFNPYFVSEEGDKIVSQILFEPLVTYDEKEKVELILAETIQYSADHLSVTMKLKEGILFSDGTPLTIGDVVNSYRLAILNGKIGTNNIKGATGFKADRSILPEGVAIADENTIVITFETYDVLNFEVLETLVHKTAHLEFSTESGFIKYVRETLGDGIGTGKFILTDSTAIPIVLQENPNYTHGERISEFKEIHVYEDTDKGVNSLIASNQVDYVAFSWESDVVNYAFANEIYDVYGKETQYVLGLANSRTSTIMENALVRESISKAISRETILSERYKPRLKAVSSLIQSNYFTEKGYINDIVEHKDEALLLYNTALKELAIEEINISFPIVKDNYMYEYIGRIIEMQLEAIGYQVEIDVLSDEEYLERVFYNTDYDVILARENLGDTSQNHTEFQEKYFIGDTATLDEVYKKIIFADTEEVQIEGYRLLDDWLEKNTGFLPLAREQTFQAISAYWNKRLKLI